MASSKQNLKMGNGVSSNIPFTSIEAALASGKFSEADIAEHVCNTPLSKPMYPPGSHNVCTRNIQGNDKSEPTILSGAGADQTNIIAVKAGGDGATGWCVVAPNACVILEDLTFSNPENLGCGMFLDGNSTMIIRRCRFKASGTPLVVGVTGRSAGCKLGLEGCIFEPGCVLYLQDNTMELYVDDVCQGFENVSVAGEPKKIMGKKILDPRVSCAIKAVADAANIIKELDGSYVRGEQRLAVYLLENGKKRRVPTETTLLAAGKCLRDVQKISTSTMNCIPEGTTIENVTKLLDPSGWNDSQRLACIVVLLADVGKFHLILSNFNQKINLSAHNDFRIAWYYAHVEHGDIVEILQCTSDSATGTVQIQAVRSKSLGVAGGETIGAAPIRTVSTMIFSVDDKGQVNGTSGFTKEDWKLQIVGKGGGNDEGSFGGRCMPAADVIHRLNIKDDGSSMGKGLDDFEINNPYKVYCSETSFQTKLDMKLEKRNTKWRPGDKDTIVIVVPRDKTKNMLRRLHHDGGDQVTFEGGGGSASLNVRDEFETFAVCEVPATKMNDIIITREVSHSQLLVTSNHNDSTRLNGFKECPMMSESYEQAPHCHQEDVTQFLYVSPKDVIATVEALAWFDVDCTVTNETSKEHAVDFVNRVARLQSRVVGYAWARDYSPMGPAGLLESSKGHCGTFNLALVYACRVRGIPARSITGAWAEIDGGLNGHITSEIWLQGYGWTFADSTNGGLHIDYANDGWGTSSDYATRYLPYHTMSGTKQDYDDSRSLMGKSWNETSTTVEDRSTSNNNLGYAGESRGRASAGYAFDGIRCYLKTESDDVGQSMSDILIPCYPPDSLIELTRVQNGTDISAAKVSENDPNLDHPYYWLKCSLRKKEEEEVLVVKHGVRAEDGAGDY